MCCLPDNLKGSSSSANVRENDLVIEEDFESQEQGSFSLFGGEKIVSEVL